MLALAFVPAKDVVEGWEILISAPKFTPPELDIPDALLDYFRSTYIGERWTRGPHKDGLFAISFWNCEELVQEGHPRTTNHVESWHRVFQQTIDGNHPTIYKFFQKLREEQNLQEGKLEGI